MRTVICIVGRESILHDCTIEHPYSYYIRFEFEKYHVIGRAMDIVSGFVRVAHSYVSQCLHQSEVASV